MGPSNYEEWLEEVGLDDTAENRGWYECEEDDRASYIEDHQEWWDNFME